MSAGLCKNVWPSVPRIDIHSCSALPSGVGQKAAGPVCLCAYYSWALPTGQTITSFPSCLWAINHYAECQALRDVHITNSCTFLDFTPADPNTEPKAVSLWSILCELLSESQRAINGLSNLSSRCTQQPQPQGSQRPRGAPHPQSSMSAGLAAA